MLAMREAGMSATPRGWDPSRSSPLPTDVDFAVVGAGLVGSAIAWGLCRSGQSVAVVDGADVERRASRANFALIWVQGKGVGYPEYATLTLQAARLWPELSSQLLLETGVDVHARQPGGLLLALSDQELDFHRRRMTALMAQPDAPAYEWSVLDNRALRQYVPEVGDEVVGGIYSSADGHCNSLKLHLALLKGVRQRGGVILPNEKVVAIEHDGRSYVMRTRTGLLRARMIVLAGGLDNAGLGDQVGLSVPVRPMRGQILVTERVRPFLNYPVMTVRQTDEGGLLLGDSFEGAVFDLSTRVPTLAVMADRARRMFPVLESVNVVRTWAGIRVMTPDGMPIYQESAQCPGVFVAACQSGVTLSPCHAFELAPALASGKLPDGWTSNFGTDRFNVRKNYF